MRFIHTFRKLSIEWIRCFYSARKLENFVNRWFFGWALIWSAVHNSFGLSIICPKQFTVTLKCLRTADINDVLGIFEKVRVFAYTDDLNIYMRVRSSNDCHLLLRYLDRLQGWFCQKNMTNAGKCKSILFSSGFICVFIFANGLKSKSCVRQINRGSFPKNEETEGSKAILTRFTNYSLVKWKSNRPMTLINLRIGPLSGH
jgi:hypothetical protein